MRIASRYDNKWKPWFAWRPVKLGEVLELNGAWVWLESVERKCYRIGPFRYSEYRLPE